FFAEEIMTCLMRSPRLESDGFGFREDDDSPFVYDIGRNKSHETWWYKFPRRYKCQYLHHKVKRDLHSRCAFSAFVHKLLELPHEPRTPKEEHELVDKLIDAWICGKFYRIRDLVDPNRCEKYFQDHQMSSLTRPRYGPWEPFEITMSAALATSAIRRGDYVELKALLSHHKDLDTYRYTPGGVLGRASGRFGGICPLDLAAKRASADIAKVLTTNQCHSEYITSKYGYTDRMLTVATKAGNREALKVWIDHLKSTGGSLYENLHSAVRGAILIQRWDMVDFLEMECGVIFTETKIEAQVESLALAILSRRVDTVREILDQGGFDINTKTEQRPYGVMFTALLEKPTSLPIMNLLLDHGANPNESHLKTKLLPLHIAVKKGDVGLARVLVEHGADIRAASLVPVKKGKLHLLLSAAQQRSTPLIQFLLMQGMENSFTSQGKRWEVKESALPRGANERVGYEFGSYVAVIHL
ncbi:hypothetical protein PENSUB_5778, partial [Penicillium subrubescens]